MSSALLPLGPFTPASPSAYEGSENRVLLSHRPVRTTLLTTDLLGTLGKMQMTLG